MGRKSDYANKKSRFTAVRQGGITAVCLLALLSVLCAFDRKDAVSMDLTHFEWKNRLLFIFAPHSGHPHLKQIQAEISDAKAGVKDRDMVVFEVLEKDPSHMSGSILPQPDAVALRKRFEIHPNTYALVLVGKDGGVKLKRNERVALNEIFELIDLMPMRRNEMRQKNE